MSKLQSYIKLRSSSRDLSQETKADVYDLEHYDYQFEKMSNRSGEIISDTQGGEIRAEILNYPSESLLGWMLNPYKRMDGEVILCEEKAGTIHEHIRFENARCTHLRFSFNEEREECILSELTVHAQRTSISDSCHIQNQKDYGTT